MKFHAELTRVIAGDRHGVDSLFDIHAHVFSDDPVALRCLSFTGAGSLLWGSDYPHDEGTFPNSQAVIERTFTDLTPEEKHQIVYDNAAHLYGLNN